MSERTGQPDWTLGELNPAVLAPLVDDYAGTAGLQDTVELEQRRALFRSRDVVQRMKTDKSIDRVVEQREIGDVTDHAERTVAEFLLCFPQRRERQVHTDSHVVFRREVEVVLVLDRPGRSVEQEASLARELPHDPKIGSMAISRRNVTEVFEKLSVGEAPVAFLPANLVVELAHAAFDRREWTLGCRDTGRTLAERDGVSGKQEIDTFDDGVEELIVADDGIGDWMIDRLAGDGTEVAGCRPSVRDLELGARSEANGTMSDRTPQDCEVVSAGWHAATVAALATLRQHIVTVCSHL